jgi:hypothetical protein
MTFRGITRARRSPTPLVGSCARRPLSVTGGTRPGLGEWDVRSLVGHTSRRPSVLSVHVAIATATGAKAAAATTPSAPARLARPVRNPGSYLRGQRLIGTTIGRLASGGGCIRPGKPRPGIPASRAGIAPRAVTPGSRQIAPGHAQTRGPSAYAAAGKRQTVRVPIVGSRCRVLICWQLRPAVGRDLGCLCRVTGQELRQLHGRRVVQVQAGRVGQAALEPHVELVT